MTCAVHVHSLFSPMGGLCSPEELCFRAKEMGYKSLALTDSNGVYGLLDFLQAAKDVGIKAIIGSEVTWEQYRFVLLCQDLKGHRGLCLLLSDLHQEVLDQSKLYRYLKDYAEHWIILSDQRFFLDWTVDILCKGHLYYELTPEFFNRQDIQWAQERGIPIAASTRARYIDPKDHFYFKLIRAIDKNSTLDQVQFIPGYNQHCYLMSVEQLKHRFALYSQALSNTQVIADMCSSEWYDTGLKFPSYNGHTEQRSSDILKARCIKNIPWRWPNPDQVLTDKIQQRLEYELSIIIPKGYSSYFLVVEDIVKQSKINCGRGSGAASIVSYLLGITHVDPIEHNLFFDRFLNPERKDPPDIDIDFAWDERDDVLDYVFRKYGNRAAMVANHNYLRGKSAAREVAKVFGIAEDEISYTLDRLPRMDVDRRWLQILKHAQKIEGIVRHLSVHCGGVVITPGPIAEYVPVEVASKGVPVIQWEKEQTEAAGLVKIDLLGNRSLAVIRDTLAAVKKNYQVDIPYESFNPIDDLATRETLVRGETMGVFYIESPATRLFFQKMKSGEFDHVVIAGSIIRPAANRYGNEFVRRLQGGTFHYLHPLLEDVLDETFGIMIYQEDVARVTMHLAGFTSHEGNDLRKVLGKKHKEKKLRHYRERFFTGAQNNGVSTAVCEQLWEMILSFAGYSFCKPHSASYALVSFKSCYLKTHFPAEFMAAVVSNRGGYYNPIAYLDEARRLGIKILPPDVNYSVEHFVGFRDCIRTGLMQIKHLSSQALLAITEEAKKGRYKNMKDFLQRTNISFSDARILAMARCFSSLRGRDRNRQTLSSLMWEIYIHFAIQNKQVEIQENNLIQWPHFPEYPKMQLVEWESQLLNGHVTFPSWALFRHILSDARLAKACDLKPHVGKTVTLFGQKISQKRVRTKNREEMSFVCFSDDTETFETVFFPRAYEEFRDLLFLGGFFLLSGEVQQEYDAIQVNIQQLKRLPNLI